MLSPSEGSKWTFSRTWPWDGAGWGEHLRPRRSAGLHACGPWGTTHVSAQGPLEWPITQHPSLHLSNLPPPRPNSQSALPEL